MTPTRAKACATCIFGPRETRLELMPGRLAEIQAYLVRGTPHACHTTNERGKTLNCRGARDYQLMIFYRMGIIADATDEALETAMANAKKGGGR